MTGDRPSAAAWRNLTLATAGFTLTFWAWNLVAPLAADFDDRLHMGASAQSLLVAVPVLVGSLGRVPVGALTDRCGARLMFPLTSALTIIPVLLLIPAKSSYAALLVVGFFLGLGGTTFAIGVPLVNSWFPPAHRGAALGVFGMGMGGVALSGFFTPRLYHRGENLPFLVIAIALAVYAVLAAFLVDDRPGRPAPTTRLATRLTQAARLRVTWELSALYAIGFGGIVAFGVYLPTYLKTWYGLSPTDAGTRAAGFALVTVVFRPLGGWLADRVHPAVVTAWALGAVALLAVVQSFDPALAPTATVCLLLMAAGLGTASGSVLALVSRVTPQPRVGSVTGIVGAMGGLGGFVPPLVMGAVYSAKSSYSIGFMLLSDLALAGCVYAYARMRTADGGTASGRAASESVTSGAVASGGAASGGAVASGGAASGTPASGGAASGGAAPGPAAPERAARGPGASERAASGPGASGPAVSQSAASEAAASGALASGPAAPERAAASGRDTQAPGNPPPGNPAPGNPAPGNPAPGNPAPGSTTSPPGRGGV